VCRFALDRLQVICRELVTGRVGFSPGRDERIVPSLGVARWLLLAPASANAASEALLDLEAAPPIVTLEPNAGARAWASVDAAGQIRLLDGGDVARSPDGKSWTHHPLPDASGREARTLVGDWLLVQTYDDRPGSQRTTLTARRVGSAGAPALGKEIVLTEVPISIDAACWHGRHVAVAFSCHRCARGKIVILDDAGAHLHDVAHGYRTITCTSEGATLGRVTVTTPTAIKVQEQRCTPGGCRLVSADLTLPAPGVARDPIEPASVPLGDRTLLVWLRGDPASESAAPFMRLAPLAELATATDVPLLVDVDGGWDLATVYAFVAGVHAVVVLFAVIHQRHRDDARADPPSGNYPSSFWGWNATAHAVRVSPDRAVHPFTRAP